MAKNFDNSFNRLLSLDVSGMGKKLRDSGWSLGSVITDDPKDPANKAKKAAERSKYPQSTPVTPSSASRKKQTSSSRSAAKSPTVIGLG